jgi:putative ABC transport system permease protein
LDYGGHKYTFAAGRNFEPDEYYGAVIGATVARESGLRVHDTFQPAHGVGPEAHEHDPFTVLGVLEPTGTPNDRALFINMEGFYLIPEHAKEVEPGAATAAKAHDDHTAGDADHHDAHEAEDHAKEAVATQDHPAGEEPAHDGDSDPEHAGHEHAETAHAHDAHDHHHHDHGEHAHEPLPIEQREVTAVLVLTASIGGAPPELMAPELIKKVNKDNVAQAVLPIREMTSLFATFVDPLRIVLLSLTVMIVIVSGIGILVSIYNSMSERQHEIAVMRALGAGRRTVMVLVLLESILLSLAGGIAGWVVGHALIALLSPWIAAQTGVSISFWQFVGYESVIIPGLIALAALVGYLPALAAYRTDVAKALGANP